MDPKSQILEAARRLFAQKGFEGTSVREIAAESEQNPAMISYYFGGKEGLYKAMLQSHLEKTLAGIQAIFSKDSIPHMSQEVFTEELRSMVALVTALQLDNAEFTRIMHRERVDNLPYSREIHEQMIGPVAEQIEEVFAAAKGSNVIRSDLDTRVFMGFLFEGVLGYLNVNQCGLKTMKGSFEFPRDRERFIDFITQLLLGGVLK
ncbi:MAG: TetR/AcrR family transcriptional regulator [Pseudobdellovibrionaceae bacterium]|jgi:AcrR family transcriptional regulator